MEIKTIGSITELPLGDMAPEDGSVYQTLDTHLLYVYNKQIDNYDPIITPSSGMANPMIAQGDIIYGKTNGVPTRLPKGVNGTVATMVNGSPAWAMPASANTNHNSMNKLDYESSGHTGFQKELNEDTIKTINGQSVLGKGDIIIAEVPINEGIPVSNGAEWGLIKDNSDDWNKSYAWGNHAEAGYLKDLKGAVLEDEPNTAKLKKITVDEIICTNPVAINITGKAESCNNSVISQKAVSLIGGKGLIYQSDTDATSVLPFSGDRKFLTGLSWDTVNKNDVGLNNVDNEKQIPCSIGIAKGDLITFSEPGSPVKLSAGKVAGCLRTDGEGNWNIDPTEYLTSLSGAEVPLTFDKGITRDDNVIENTLITGKKGGQTITSGNNGGDDLTITSTSHAQKGRINIGKLVYDESTDSILIGAISIKDVLVVPRMTTEKKEAIENPIEGMVVWDTTNHVLSCYNGTNWD